MKHFIASIFFIIAAATQKTLPSENRNVICNSLANTITSQDTLKEPTAVIEKVIFKTRNDDDGEMNISNTFIYLLRN